MHSTTGIAPDRSRGMRPRSMFGTPLSLCIAVLLTLSANAACAAALGSLSSSVGLVAALAALFVIKSWQAHLPASALSTAGGALLIAAGAAWLWRVRAVGRVAALAGSTGHSASMASVVRPMPMAGIVLPDGFDREALLLELRRHFVRLQHAWDHAEMAALRELTTPEMLDELCLELPGFMSGDSHADCTEVVTLRADLLGFESLAQVLVVSVEFSGLMRESSERGSVPFRELWLLTRSKHDAAAWRLARHQALI